LDCNPLEFKKQWINSVNKDKQRIFKLNQSLIKQSKIIPLQKKIIFLFFWKACICTFSHWFGTTISTTKDNLSIFASEYKGKLSEYWRECVFDKNTIFSIEDQYYLNRKAPNNSLILISLLKWIILLQISSPPPPPLWQLLQYLFLLLTFVWLQVE